MGRLLYHQQPALVQTCVEVRSHVHPTARDLRRNLPSIQRLGIDPALSRSQWRVCWFCHPRRRDWAIAHVADRYGVSPAEVIVLRISIPRSLLTHRGRASWTCPAVVRNIVAVSLPAAA